MTKVDKAKRVHPAKPATDKPAAPQQSFTPSMTTKTFLFSRRFIACVTATVVFDTPPTAIAQAQQIDIGTWSCPAIGHYVNEGPYTQNCTGINFTKPFAEPPKVMMSAQNYFLGLVSIDATNVTELGFVPRLVSGGGIGWTGGWVAVGSPLTQGLLHPRFLILTIVYAPPGSGGSGGGVNSTVVYAAESSTGFSTSAGKSFTTSNSVRADSSGSLFGNGGGAGISFDYSKSTTDTTGVDIKKSTGTTITRNGTQSPGVNHDDDQLLVWLNPVIAASVGPTSIAWHFDQTAPAVLQWLTVRELKNPTLMADGTRRLLASYGVTEQDFELIAQRDPFSDPRYRLDPARFVSINFWFPYQPPTSPGGTVPTFTYKVGASTTTTQGHSVEDTYKVAMTFTVTVGASDFFQTKITDTQSWAWANRSTQTSSSGSSESASVTVGGPPAPYTGSTQVAVYYDLLYKTFDFEMVPLSALSKPSREGVLLDASGKPRAGVIMRTKVGDAIFDAATDREGHYRFYDARSVGGTVEEVAPR
jgi:hypothetical protein